MEAVRRAIMSCQRTWARLSMLIVSRARDVISPEQAEAHRLIISAVVDGDFPRQD